MQNNDPRNIFFNQRNERQQGQSQQSQQSQSQQGYQSHQGYNTQQSQQQGQQPYEERLEQMKKLAQKYQREGESQLVQDILNNVLEQKAKGQLSNDQLRAFAKRITPLLNGEQRQRLNDLVEQLVKL